MRETDLSSSSVNGIGVESNIHNVESSTSHNLLSARSLLRRPLERSDARTTTRVRQHAVLTERRWGDGRAAARARQKNEEKSKKSTESTKTRRRLTP